METTKRYTGTEEEMKTLFNESEFLSVRLFDDKKELSKKDNFSFSITLRFSEDLENEIKTIKTISKLLTLDRKLVSDYNEKQRNNRNNRLLSVSRDTRDILFSKNIEEPYYINRKEFLKFHFLVIDPISKIELKRYTLTAKEFDEKPYEEKKEFKKLEKIEEFDEDSFIDMEKQYKLDLKEYQIVFTLEYDKRLVELNITKEESLKVNKIMRTISDYCDFDSYQNPDEQKIMLELDLIVDIKEK